MQDIALGWRIYTIYCNRWEGRVLKTIHDVRQALKGLSGNELVLLLLTASIFLTVYVEIAVLVLLPVYILVTKQAFILLRRKQDTAVFIDFLGSVHGRDHRAGRDTVGHRHRPAHGLCVYCDDLHHLYDDAAHFPCHPVLYLPHERVLLCSGTHPEMPGYDLGMGRTLFLRFFESELLCVLYLAGGAVLPVQYLQMPPLAKQAALLAAHPAEPRGAVLDRVPDNLCRAAFKRAGAARVLSPEALARAVSGAAGRGLRCPCRLSGQGAAAPAGGRDWHGLC